ncbi:MAG: DNA recombination protein RmuC [Thermoplasmata archaeon]
MIEVLLLLIGLVAGFAAGFFFARLRMYQSVDLSTQSYALSGLSAQIAEMKARFVEIERSRERLDAERQRFEQERERRFGEFVGNIHRLFQEMSEKSAQTDAEKEKRIRELMEHNRRFFEEQKLATERFLMEQRRSREEIERRRDAQIADMNRMIETFTKAVAGTKSRGMVGEELLKEALRESIVAGVVRCNLQTEGGPVEFAWCLGDGMHIPIDSKLPDVFELLEAYRSAGPDEQRDIKREIINKVRGEIEKVRKYQNTPNTIDSCILVVPEGVLELAPELVGIGRAEGVYVCTYREVFPVAHLLQERYIRMREEGEAGEYRRALEAMGQMLDKIGGKVDTIERGLTIIKNASETMRDEIALARRQGALARADRVAKGGGEDEE